MSSSQLSVSTSDPHTISADGNGALIQLAAIQNREILAQTIRQCFEDGDYSAEEEEHVERLAQQLSVSTSEVAGIINQEAGEIIKRVFLECMEDGLVTPDEEARLHELARGLRANVKFDEASRAALEAGKQNWAILRGPIESITTIVAPINLHSGEHCFAEIPVAWNETRRRTVRTDYGGVSTRFRVMKGVYIRLGSTSSNRVSEDVLTPIDQGHLYVTNKRFVFIGSKGGKQIRFTSVLVVNSYADGLEVIKSTGKSPVLEFLDPQQAQDASIHLLVRRFFGG